MPTNTARANAAKSALKAYRAAKNGPRATPDEADLRDLLCDLMHLCKSSAKLQAFEPALISARNNFDHEAGTIRAATPATAPRVWIIDSTWGHDEIAETKGPDLDGHELTFRRLFSTESEADAIAAVIVNDWRDEADLARDATPATWRAKLAELHTADNSAPGEEGCHNLTITAFEIPAESATEK